MATQVDLFHVILIVEQPFRVSPPLGDVMVIAGAMVNTAALTAYNVKSEVLLAFTKQLADTVFGTVQL